MIFSNHTAKDNFRDAGDGLWGAYGYSADQDVIRVAMEVEQIDVSIDQFSIMFFNVTSTGGSLAMLWESTMATTSFTVAQ